MERVQTVERPLADLENAIVKVELDENVTNIEQLEEVIQHAGYEIQ